MIMIDGARIVTPGVIHYALKAHAAYECPFVYTLSMHLGPQPQYKSMLTGYNQTVEDDLLKTIDWRNDGYNLFLVSSLASSSKDGYYGDMAESNCIAVSRQHYRRLGGFDERFSSEGGGLVNLDFFNRADGR